MELTDFKQLIKIRWTIDKFLTDYFFIGDEDMQELIKIIKPFTDAYSNKTFLYNPNVNGWHQINTIERTIDNIYFKLELNGINKTLLNRYYLMAYDLEYINNYEDIDDLKELSINLMDSLQKTILIKIYDDETQKIINNYDKLYNLINQTIKTEIKKIELGQYK